MFVETYPTLRRDTDGQEIQEKTLCIINHQEREQNHKETPLTLLRWPQLKNGE